MAAVTQVERGPSVVPVQVKESGSAAGIIGVVLIFLAIIGGLLIFLGIIGPIGTLVGGAASFVGGTLLTSVGGRQLAPAALAGVH